MPSAVILNEALKVHVGSKFQLVIEFPRQSFNLKFVLKILYYSLGDHFW